MHNSTLARRCRVKGQPYIICDWESVQRMLLRLKDCEVLGKGCVNLFQDLCRYGFITDREVARLPVEVMCRALCLRRHEDAALYADFEDFSFFRLTEPEAHYVAGFGRVNRISEPDLVTPQLPTNDPELNEENIIHHMNEDHRSALDDMAQFYCGTELASWQMTGLDAEGFDLRSGGRAERIDFPEILPEISMARVFLMEMTKASRK